MQKAQARPTTWRLVPLNQVPRVLKSVAQGEETGPAKPAR